MKDDLGLIVSPEAPTFTHYVKEFYIDQYKGIPYLCAQLHIFSEDDGFDNIATENIKRLRALINAHVMLPVSMICVAFWASSPGSKQDIAKKIKTIKSCDFTVCPSFGVNSRIFEVTDDNGKIIESEKEKEYSVVDDNDFDGVIKVKTFSDLSGFDLKDTPKSSKINGQYTQLKVKEFSFNSEVCIIDDVKVEENIEQPEQKEFTQADVRNRLREARMSPRLYFRRVYMSYSQVMKTMGSNLKEDDLKILKSMFTSDVLFILNRIQPEVLKGKQINTLLGCSSISKTARVLAQNLQLPLRMAMVEINKNGFLSKMRYQKLQAAYLEFIHGLIDSIFGPNPEPIKEEETNIEEGK